MQVLFLRTKRGKESIRTSGNYKHSIRQHTTALMALADSQFFGSLSAMADHSDITAEPPETPTLTLTEKRGLSPVNPFLILNLESGISESNISDRKIVRLLAQSIS